jgi:mRNA interferase MazF
MCKYMDWEKIIKKRITEHDEKLGSLSGQLEYEILYEEYYKIEQSNSIINNGDLPQVKNDGINKENISMRQSKPIHEGSSLLTNHNKYKVFRGDIFFAELGSGMGSEQGGTRPVIIIQNDIANRFSVTVTVIPVTRQISKGKLPSHVELIIDGENCVAMAEQMRVITMERLTKFIGKVSEQTLSNIQKSIIIQLGMTDLLS